MAGASRETPPLLGQDAFGYYQTFSKNISDFLLAHGIEISLPKGVLQGIKCWFVKLSDGTHLHVYAEATSEQNAACDQCRIIGWGTHPVSSLRYHFIIPVEIGPDSLQDPAALPHIAEACFRSKKQVSRAVSLPSSTVITAEGHISPYNAPSTIFDSTKHRLHGVLHSNGFGHLLRVNGREGGSQSHTGFQLVTLWDALCQGLRARKVTTEDVSSKIGMELRILFTAAYGYTWYGTFGYEFGRGPYNTSKDRWLAAMHMIQTTSLAHILHDFEGVEDGVPAVVKRYRLPIGPGAARVKDLGSLLYRLLYLQSNPKDAVQFFENKTVAEAEAGIKAQDDAEAAKRAAQRAGGNGGQFGSGNTSKKAAVGLPKLPPQPQKSSGPAPPLPKIKLRLGPGGPAAAAAGAATTTTTTTKGEKLVSPAVSPTKQKRGRAAIEADEQDLVASPSAAKRSRATAPPRPIIGRKVRVYYKDKRTWYHGTIEKKEGPAASNRYIVAFKNFKDKLDLSDETNIIEFADGPAPVLGGGGSGGGASGSGVVSVVSGKMKEGKKKQQVPEPVAASPRKKAPGGGGGDGGDDNNSINLPEVGSKVKVYNPDRRAWKSALVTSLTEVKGSEKSAKQKSSSSSSIFQITFLDGSTEDLDFSEIKWQLLEPPQPSPKEEDSEEEESEEEESDSESEEFEEESEEEDIVPPVQYKAILSRDDGVERTRQLTRALKSLCPLVRDVFGEAKGRAELDAILNKLSKGGCPELTCTKTWWESLPKLLRWAQTGINGAVGRGVKDAGKAVRLVDEFLEINKAQLHALGLFPEVWPAPFQITAVKKANAKVIAQMEKEKLKKEKEAEKRKLKLKEEKAKAKAKAKEKEKEKEKKVVKVVEKKSSGSAAGGKQEGGRATRRSRNDDKTLVSLPDPVAPPLPRPTKTTAAATLAETAAKKKGKHAEAAIKPEPATTTTQAAKISTTAAAAPLASPPAAAATTSAAAHLEGAQQQQQQEQATAPRLPPPPPSLPRPNSVVARAGPLSPLPAPALRSATASPPLSEEAIKQLVAAPTGLDQLPADRFSRPLGTTLPVLILPSDAPPWGLDRLETALNHVMAIAKAHKGRWVSPQRVVTLAQQSFSKLGLKDISLAQAAMAYLANTTFQGCAVHRYAHPEGGNYYFTEELPGMYSPPLLRAAPAAGAAVASPLLPPPHPPRIMSAPTAPALGTAPFNPTTTAQKNHQQVVKVEDTNTTTTGGKTRNSKRQKAVDGDDDDDQGAGPSKPPPGGGPGGVIPVISGSQQQNNKGNKFKLRIGASSAQPPPPPSTVQQPKTGISRSAIQQQAVDHALAIVLAPVPSISLLPAAIPPPQLPTGAVLVASPPPPPPPAWLSLVPGASIRQPPSMQNARNQVSRDLHHVFTAVLKVYAPLIAKQAAENAALVAGERATTRVLKLKQFAEEVQVMRDTKHFLKPCSGETLNPKEGPVPPKGQLRIWCKLAMPIELASPPVAPTRFGRKFLPVDPPAELIVLPEDATLGQFMAASQELYRGIYRMCANFTASGVVSGLYVGGSVGGGGGGKSGGASGSKSAPLKSPMAAVWDPSMPLAAMLPKEPPHPGPALSTLISTAADGGGHGALAGLGGASGSAAGGIINTSNPGFAAGVFIPTITIAGVGLDTTPAWLHAGGPEDWIVGCSCGTRDDDGEAMVACDSCGVWYHTRCVKVPDDCPSYVCTLCEKKRKHTSLG